MQRRGLGPGRSCAWEGLLSAYGESLVREDVAPAVDKQLFDQQLKEGFGFWGSASATIWSRWSATATKSAAVGVGLVRRSEREFGLLAADVVEACLKAHELGAMSNGMILCCHGASGCKRAF
jgi:hypothetical protein